MDIFTLADKTTMLSWKTGKQIPSDTASHLCRMDLSRVYLCDCLIIKCSEMSDFVWHWVSKHELCKWIFYGLLPPSWSVDGYSKCCFIFLKQWFHSTILWYHLTKGFIDQLVQHYVLLKWHTVPFKITVPIGCKIILEYKVMWRCPCA